MTDPAEISVKLQSLAEGYTAAWCGGDPARVAGITRVDFREFYGYGLIYAALWFVLGVIVFTFAPC